MTMTTQPEQARAEPRRIVTQVSALDELVGAHPDALRKIYGRGTATDPAELGDAPRGRILSMLSAEKAFMLTRPVVQALKTNALPWRGKEFDHGGNAGVNVVFGKRVFRFRTEVGPSALDGQDTLALIYGVKAFKNPWPISAIRDELRTVANGIAMGPAFYEWRGGQILWLWFGLERIRGS